MRTRLQGQIDAMVADFQAVREAADAFGAQLAAMTATARSTDHSVVVTVGARGELVDLRFNDHAVRLDLAALRARVLEAGALAAADVRQRTRAATAEFLPGQLRGLIGPDGTVNLDSLLPRDLAGPAPAPPGGGR